MAKREVAGVDATTDLAATAKDLIEKAYAAESSDNISVVVALSAATPLDENPRFLMKIRYEVFFKIVFFFSYVCLFV